MSDKFMFYVVVCGATVSVIASITSIWETKREDVIAKLVRSEVTAQLEQIFKDEVKK